jgi:hypothetical protein
MVITLLTTNLRNEKARELVRTEEVDVELLQELVKRLD